MKSCVSGIAAEILCIHFISVLHTKLVTKDLKKETVHWRMRQHHADEPKCSNEARVWLARW